MSTGVGVWFHLRDKLATIFAPEPKTKQQQQKTAPDFNQLRPMRSNHYLRLNTCQAILCYGRYKDELWGSGCRTGVSTDLLSKLLRSWVRILPGAGLFSLSIAQKCVLNQVPCRGAALLNKKMDGYLCCLGQNKQNMHRSDNKRK